jgi:hypothetical protein
MARGEYRSFIGSNGKLPPKTESLRGGGGESPAPLAPPAPPAPPDRGQYTPRTSWDQKRPWTESQHQAFQRSLGLSAIGSVAGAVLWKSHRVWGFILGGMAGGGVGNLIFAPPSGLPLYER